MARKLLRNFGLNLLKLFLVGDLLYLSINGVNYFAKKTTPIRTQIELESMLKKVGFRNITRINLDSEKNFIAWLAQK